MRRMSLGPMRLLFPVRAPASRGDGGGGRGEAGPPDEGVVQAASAAVSRKHCPGPVLRTKKKRAVRLAVRPAPGRESRPPPEPRLAMAVRNPSPRSEEHTSELQSPLHI